MEWCIYLLDWMLIRNIHLFYTSTLDLTFSLLPTRIRLSGKTKLWNFTCKSLNVFVSLWHFVVKRLVCFMCKSRVLHLMLFNMFYFKNFILHSRNCGVNDCKRFPICEVYWVAGCQFSQWAELSDSTSTSCNYHSKFRTWVWSIIKCQISQYCVIVKILWPAIIPEQRSNIWCIIQVTKRGC